MAFFAICRILILKVFNSRVLMQNVGTKKLKDSLEKRFFSWSKSIKACYIIFLIKEADN